MEKQPPQMKGCDKCSYLEAAPVIVSLADKDVDIMDNETLEWECQCGVSLELVHLRDWDRCYVWFGGICGHCGRTQDVDGEWFEVVN